MREASLQKGVPIISASDRHALGTGRPDINRALGYAGRPAIRALRAVCNGDDGARPMRGHHNDRICHSLKLGALDQQLQSWLEILLHDTGESVLPERGRRQVCGTKWLAGLVVDAEDKIATAMIGKRGDMAGC